jgi:limonene-1,2-epoxide hydrolase
MRQWSKSAMTNEISRRHLLMLGAMATTLGGASSSVATADWMAIEQANTRTVTDFCAGWAARNIETLVPFFAAKAVYRVTETSQPIVGRDAIVDFAKKFFERMTSVEFKVTETFAKGPLVLNERVDTFISPQRTQRYHAVGMFYLVDDKIVEWTDYIMKD